MLRWLHGDDCGIALDSRYEPIVITTWYGSPTCALIDEYFRWSDATTAAAMASEQRLVHVVDLRHARRPSALARKRGVEHMREDLFAEVRLASIVVAEPVLGAVVRFDARMSQLRHAPSIVETIEAALELALLELRAARIPAPVGLTPRRYRAPALVSAR
jgi:hypothetical protein